MFERVLNVWFLLHIGETFNKTDIRKAKNWFANEVMDLAVEQSKTNDIKLISRTSSNNIKR